MAATTDTFVFFARPGQQSYARPLDFTVSGVKVNGTTATYTDINAVVTITGRTIAGGETIAVSGTVAPLFDSQTTPTPPTTPLPTTLVGYTDENGGAPDPATYLLWAADDGTLNVSYGSYWVSVFAPGAYMRAAVYDTNGDGKVDAAATADSIGSYGVPFFETLQSQVAVLNNKVLAESVFTATTTLGSANWGVYNRFDATNGGITVAVPGTGGVADGTWFGIRKADTSANQVLVSFGGLLVPLSDAYDEVVFVCWGGAWRVKSKRIKPLRQLLTSSTTWTKWGLASTVKRRVIGGGPGGGSGRRGASGTARTGGAGGNGAEVWEDVVLAADLPLTAITMTVGAAGSGGAAVTVDSTNGNAGTAGGTTRFGAATDAFALTAAGGAGGLGGSTTTVTQPVPSSGTVPSGQGGSPAAAGGSGGSGVRGITSGGAAGGGITTADAPGNGGSAKTYVGNNLGGGTAPSGNGTNGGAPQAINGVSPGEAGSGGAGGSSSTPGGTGGNAGGYGCAGGGGGASFNGQPSGPGGTGTGGCIEITTHFD